MKGTAIVITYNSADWIERSLDALLAHPDWEVLMLDNASQDDTVLRASRYASYARIYENSVNTGFSGGVNQGVRLASGDVLVLVNPDAIAAPGALDRLAETLSKHNVAAAGGLLRLEDRRPQTGNMVRKLPTLGATLAELLLLNNLWWRNPWNRSYRCLDMNATQAQPVENPAGASLAFKRSAWEAVGGFDEGFFPVWFEDADFCARVLKAGLKIMYQPDAVFDHGGAHSVNQMSFYEHQAIWYRNLLLYFEKHNGRLHRAILRAASAVGLSLRALLCLITKPDKVRRKEGMIAYLRAAWNCGFRNPKTKPQTPRSQTAPPPLLIEKAPTGAR